VCVGTLLVHDDGQHSLILHSLVLYIRLLLLRPYQRGGILLFVCELAVARTTTSGMQLGIHHRKIYMEVY